MLPPLSGKFLSVDNQQVSSHLLFWWKQCYGSGPGFLDISDTDPSLFVLDLYFFTFFSLTFEVNESSKNVKLKALKKKLIMSANDKTA
jgi:hypothetical protein